MQDKPICELLLLIIFVRVLFYLVCDCTLLADLISNFFDVAGVDAQEKRQREIY